MGARLYKPIEMPKTLRPFCYTGGLVGCIIIIFNFYYPNMTCEESNLVGGLIFLGIITGCLMGLAINRLIALIIRKPSF
jgi:hypothetical protein